MISKIYGVMFLVSASALIAGCNGGGSGSSSGTSGSSGYYASYTDGGNNDPGINDPGQGAGTETTPTELATVHNPEPSSLLLLGSGLMGLAVYAKSKLRGKRRK